jgi:hypothetical protein
VAHFFNDKQAREEQDSKQEAVFHESVLQLAVYAVGVPKTIIT